MLSQAKMSQSSSCNRNKRIIQLCRSDYSFKLFIQKPMTPLIAFSEGGDNLLEGYCKRPLFLFDSILFLCGTEVFCKTDCK